jgi:SAM-dependent methyltransferase
MTSELKERHVSVNFGDDRNGNWFTSPLGMRVLAMEKSRISQVLPDLFGYHILQINGQAADQLLVSSRIHHKIVFDKKDSCKSGKYPDVVCRSHALPVASESIDVLVLPHVLEFSSSPHSILRECERVLIGEGHLIIIGFNPYSFYGFWRLLLAWRAKLPWCGHYIELTRLKDWLSLLDFEIIKAERFFFRPPFSNVKLLDKLSFMEQLGQFCWSYFGGIYLLVAKKKVISMTPIKLQWQTRRHMISTGAIEPSARIIYDN